MKVELLVQRSRWLQGAPRRIAAVIVSRPGLTLQALRVVLQCRRYTDVSLEALHVTCDVTLQAFLVGYTAAGVTLQALRLCRSQDCSSGCVVPCIC